MITGYETGPQASIYKHEISMAPMGAEPRQAQAGRQIGWIGGWRDWHLARYRIKDV
jgi:hypothetical protein